jgi:hypothetical protein
MNQLINKLKRGDMKTIVNFRTNEKEYYLATCERISSEIKKMNPNADRIEYGKQDQRGGYYICVFLEDSSCSAWGSVFGDLKEFKSYLRGIDDLSGRLSL